MSSYSDQILAAFGGDSAPEADPQRLGGLCDFLRSHASQQKPSLKELWGHLEQYTQRLLLESENFEKSQKALNSSEESLPAGFLAQVQEVSNSFAEHAEAAEELRELLQSEDYKQDLEFATESLQDTGTRLEEGMTILVHWGRD